jgi:imidazolonepropionase-like amidohydrolase
MLQTVAALAEAGVPILAGTDTPNPFVVPGASLQQELELLTRAGLDIEGAWAAATWRAGEALRVQGLGTLAEGAPADLLVFRQDPTRDLAALASLETVVADGRVYSKAALDAAVQRHLAHADAWLPGSLSRLQAELVLSLLRR